MSSLAKIGEITLELNKDIKKGDKVCLNDILSFTEREKRDITVSEDAKKGAKIKLTIETA
ncbi:MAG: hypothetical protein QXK34_02755 [Candidatus Bathyarchaeia archaeon]